MGTIIASALGGAIGLISLLIGALFNAHLNRRHERWQLKREEWTLRQTLAAELKALSTIALDRIGFLLVAADGQLAEDYPLSTRLAIPRTAIFEALVEKIGHLPPETAAAVVAVYAHWDVIRNLIKVGACGDNGPKVAQQRMESAQEFQRHVDEVVKKLENND